MPTVYEILKASGDAQIAELDNMCSEASTMSRPPPSRSTKRRRRSSAVCSQPDLSASFLNSLTLSP